jgi:hypothetical protein
MRHGCLAWLMGLGILGILAAEVRAQAPAAPVAPAAQDPLKPPATGQGRPEERQPTSPPGSARPGEPVAAAPSTTSQEINELAGQGESRAPEMLGDPLGRPWLRCFTPTQLAGQKVQFCEAFPGRSFKISDNESPLPMDRVYFEYNHFENVYASYNRRLGGIFHDGSVDRETFGIEKSMCDGLLSLGIRQPLHQLSQNVSPPRNFDLPPVFFAGLPTSDYETGDLSLIVKFAPFADCNRQSGLSIGLAVTLPTGQSDDPAHSTSLAPFIGYLWRMGDWLLHGFISLDIPTKGDVTYLYNDVGVGYYLYQNPCRDGCLTAVIPTVEFHVGTPLNHRGGVEFVPPFDFTIGAADFVELTTGVNFELWQRMRLGLGVVTPLTGPRPFDWEGMVQLRWRF